ncbi:PIR protein [Plasmodium vivax]|nr:PIR protein [Plasmodium vivax]
MRYIYPFLNDIWEQYEEFEKPLDYNNDDKVLFYQNTCELIIRRTNKNNEKYKDFCMKLIRNLGPYSRDYKVYNPSQERCKTLHYWLYYKIGDLDFSEKFLSEIFQEAKELTSGQPLMKICDYNYNKNIKEPKNIIKLLNLQENGDICERILSREINKDYCLCEKYINECVNIYKSMNKMYCSGPTDKETNNDTCSQLRTFDTTYTSFLFKEQQLSGKIPSLTSSNNEYVGKCNIVQRVPVVISSEEDSSANPKKISVTGTIGTMAGVSSVLALLYKITPAGSWINSKLRGSGRSINTNLYTEGASELLTEEPLLENINSYNIGYEVA